MNRILAKTRNRGIFQARIKSPANLAAGRALEKQFGLKKVVQFQTTRTSDELPASIANAVGAAGSNRLKSGMKLDVGWRRTLQLSVWSMKRKYIANFR